MLDDKRGVAINKFQLGTVLIFQQRYDEALEIYTEARNTFESLGEPLLVANTWHQIGMVHRQAEQFEQAERAFQHSLASYVQQKDLAGEAKSLGELGNLYYDIGRLEHAVKCHQQAADIHIELQDQRYEGVSRSNLAQSLIKLQRYEEARRELLRAIECKKPYGHASEPWKTWSILSKLEQAINSPQAAAHARQKAIESYLAYRHDGGQNMTNGAHLCAFTIHAIKQADTIELEQLLAQISGTDVPPSAKIIISKLQAILLGDREPALSDDPNLHYTDAAELQLLLEALGTK
jgi:tetratricopeptide (TPR) repeat protein